MQEIAYDFGGERKFVNRVLKCFSEKSITRKKTERTENIKKKNDTHRSYNTYDTTYKKTRTNNDIRITTQSCSNNGEWIRNINIFGIGGKGNIQ